MICYHTSQMFYVRPTYAHHMSENILLYAEWPQMPLLACIVLTQDV